MNIEITYWPNAEFIFEGKEYYIPSTFDILTEVAYDMGRIESDYIDPTIYEGSPYATQYRRANANDVTEEDVDKFIKKNQDRWKLLEE